MVLSFWMVIYIEMNNESRFVNAVKSTAYVNKKLNYKKCFHILIQFSN